MPSSPITQLPLAPIPRLALRRPEAAEAIGVSDRTLWEWTKAGVVPHFKEGSIVLYPVAELAAWLAERSKQAGASAGESGDVS